MCGTSPTPSQLDWAAEVDEALGLSPAVHDPGIMPPGPEANMPPRIETDPGNTTFATPTTSGITGPAYGPIFDHHALVNSPRDLTSPRGRQEITRAVFTSAPPSNVDPINVAHDPTHIMPADITPGDPVAVDPVRRAHQTFDWESFGLFWP